MSESTNAGHPVSTYFDADEVEAALRTLAELYDNAGEDAGEYLSTYQLQLASRVAKRVEASYPDDEDDEDDEELDLPEGVTLTRGTLPTDAPPEGHVHLVLKIDNTYENYDDVTTYAVATVPEPPDEDDEDEYDEWKMTNIIDPFTGVGHTDGDSWYDVTVLESSAPDLIPVGTQYEFGY